MPDPITIDPIVDTYAVTDGANVTAHVIIGDGQPGGTSAALEGIELDHGNEDLRVVVGSGQTIRNRTLTVAGVTQDTIPETDNTSFTLELTGGTDGPQRFGKQFVAEKGQQVTYGASITFI